MIRPGRSMLSNSKFCKLTESLAIAEFEIGELFKPAMLNFSVSTEMLLKKSLPQVDSKCSFRTAVADLLLPNELLNSSYLILYRIDCFSHSVHGKLMNPFPKSEST
eukprot:NODE_51_length_27121_cov_0.309452.p20 type:complete len:106 gc:universal NODE_51_length_27121_cov_0.309452:10685-11002(+)